MLRYAILAVLLLPAAEALAEPATADGDAAEAADENGVTEPPAKTVCELIDEAAEEHGLPADFFTRLIWQESTFRPGAVSPKGAQGIAQFMPTTAARRGLADPFDPIAAIPASAHYLSDLARQFGNLGLAAAAYNAGEQRVADWLAGDRGLPLETRNYVWSITGHAADDWKADAPEWTAPPSEAAPDTAAGCAEIAALLSRPGTGSALVSRRPRADWAPWGAQVAGNFSVERAMARYAALQDRHGDLLGGIAPMVVSAVQRSRGTAPLHTVRLPAATREAAEDLCAKLRKAGVACVVMKTPQ
jgi:hypothetical protein